MKEYIEREAVIQLIKTDGHDGDYNLGATADNEWFCAEVKRIPAADVVEVRHEKWTPAYYGHVNYVRCTGCGSYFEDSIFAHEDSVEYCPHCGAKMDGGADDA